MLRLTPTWAIWCNGNTRKKGGIARGGVMSVKTCYISETVQDYYTVIRSPSSAFQWSQNAWLWMTSKRDSRCFMLALAPDAPASTRLPCLAYINVPLSLIVKFDTYRNWQRHRAVLHAIARHLVRDWCKRPYDLLPIFGRAQSIYWKEQIAISVNDALLLKQFVC